MLLPCTAVYADAGGDELVLATTYEPSTGHSSVHMRQYTVRRRIYAATYTVT